MTEVPASGPPDIVLRAERVELRRGVRVILAGVTCDIHRASAASGSDIAR